MERLGFNFLFLSFMKKEKKQVKKRNERKKEKERMKEGKNHIIHLQGRSE